jgi:glycosyltransferase involved in cell wall biosynthesis
MPDDKEKTSQPTVTVVTPCYNGSPFLRETLESVLGQTYPVKEIIVIDDGSTDDSAAIAESFGPPVRVIRQENQGESVARNRGIEEAHGDWIAFLDADDLWKPHKLERQIAAIEPNVVAVHTNLYFFGSASGTTKIQDKPASVRYAIEELALKNTFGSPSSLIVRREISPRFPTWTRYAEDLVFCLDLVRCGEIRLITEPLTGYRKHRTSQSANRSIAVHWHATIERWLKLNKPYLSEQQCSRIHENWMLELSHLAWRLKAERHWTEYWQVRNYLEAHRGDPNVNLVLENKIFPRWAYFAQDLAVWIRRRSQYLLAQTGVFRANANN